MPPKASEPQPSEEFAKFKALTKKLVSVPKTEIDKREKARKKKARKSA